MNIFRWYMSLGPEKEAKLVKIVTALLISFLSIQVTICLIQREFLTATIPFTAAAFIFLGAEHLVTALQDIHDRKHSLLERLLGRMLMPK